MMQGNWMGDWGAGYMGWSGGLWMLMIGIVITVGIVDLIYKK